MHLGQEDRLVIACLGDDLALGIDDDGVTPQGDVGVAADAVAGDDPRQVLDRPCASEDSPMLDARRRPAGAEQEGLCT